MNYENRDYIFNAGECVFVKRDCNIRLTKLPDEIGNSFNGIFFVLDQEFLKNESKNHKVSNSAVSIRPIIEIEKNETLDIFFKTFFSYFDNNIEPSTEIINAKKVEGLYTILQIKPELVNFLFDFNKNNKINLQNFMENNYKEDLTLEEFAYYLYRSLSTFKREFKKIFNENPHKWILDKKLNDAQELLKSGKKPLKYI